MKQHHDFRILYQHLLPLLRPYFWPILGSLCLTGLVIGTDMIQPTCLKWLLDAATLTLNYPVVVQCLLLLLGLVVIRSLLSYWEIFCRSKVGEALSHRYRENVFAHILHLPLALFSEQETGALIHRIMNDCGQIGRVYVSTKLLPMIAQVAQTAALITLLLLLNWPIGLACILLFPLGWVLSQQMTRRSQDNVVHLRSLVEDGHEMLQEIFSCLREVRATCNEPGEMRRWGTWLQDYGRIVCASTTQHQFVRTTLSRLIDWLGLCIVFGFGGWQLLMHHMTIGTLLALSLYVQQLYAILSTLLSGRLETREAVNALAAINEILSLPQERPDQGKPFADGPGHLAFHDVSFSYNETQTLSHVSFTSNPGQVTGIVGTTGSGKSTIIHLCMGFYPVAGGTILLDGQDISEIAPHALRQQIALVSQDITLWNTTIRANLLYGLPREIPWEQVREICERTRVDAFVQQLPLGYETIVGSRGMKLSGGEKQRIALARALLRDPKILLLDEATSALDSITEAELVKYLLERGAQKNCLVVAHRLSTVQSANQIIVVEGGKIIEHDSPEALSRRNRVYATLYRTQQLPISNSEGIA